MALYFEIERITASKADYLFHPFVQVRLATFTTGDYGKIMVGPRLMSEIEVDCFFDTLTKELEEARRECKRGIKKK